MQQTETALMPPVRRPGRSLVEPSHAKASKVRTWPQHDWSMVETRNQARDHFQTQEHGWTPREAPRMKHGDAVHVGSVGVAHRSSRAEKASRDLPSRSKKTQISTIPQDRMLEGYSSNALQPAVSSHLIRQPSARRADDKKRHPQGRRRLTSPSSADQQLQALGAWSDASRIRHRGVPVEFLRDNKLYHAVQTMPDTPRHVRLPTPDLEPLPKGHEFCACCVDATEELDEAWYQAGKARMDAQLESAMAHITAMSSGGRRRLEF